MREAVKTNFTTIKHVGSKINIADFLTKEDRDKHHYLEVHDVVHSSPLSATAMKPAVAKTVELVQAGDILLGVTRMYAHYANPEK
eukprot:15339220-Ditylum_brightwellii.AAC.1